MAAFPAFLDTCVMYGGVLNDLLLRLAEDGAFRLLWSERVLADLERHLLERIGVERARRRVDLMRRAFPNAMVSGYEHLEHLMRVDANDRHVAAAAVHGGAEVIVTANLRDFPVSALAPFDVVRRSPDDFLLDQLDLYPDKVRRCLDDMADAYESPPLTLQQVLSRLALDAPAFVRAARGGEGA